MKKFIVKILLFLGLFIFSAVLLTCFDILIIKNQYLGSYQASLIDKVRRLKEIDEPKIVLVGNSNVAFGIDSEKIEKAFDMPVVNLGLHGDLGNAFHENIAKLSISQGDIIIICHSDYSDNGRIKDPVLAWTAIELHTMLWGILDKEDYFDMLKAYPKYIIRAGYFWMTGNGNQQRSNTCYSRSAFNKYGDNICNLDNHYDFSSYNCATLEISDICIERLNELNKYVNENGAVLLVAGYPIGYGEYMLPSETYVRWERELRERLDCEVISTFTDYFYPYEYFYDHSLHLNQKGAEMRTEQLIEDLNHWKCIHS